MKHIITGDLSQLSPFKKNAKKASGSSWRSKFQFSLNCALVILLLQAFSSQAIAQVTLPGVTLTTTAGTMNSTTSCVGSGGYYANGWTGTPTKYWEYTVSTVGYTNILFDIPTSSSGTGPHTGSIYCDYGSGFQLVTNYSWTGTGCKTIAGLLSGAVDLSAWNSSVENVANLKVRLYMTGASSASGTNRVHPDGFVGTASGCSGAPTGGSITAGVSSFCGFGSTTLTLTGASGGTGIDYQWQESANGTSGWADISGATSAAYNTAVISSTNYYRVRVICTTTNDTSYSSTQQLTIVAKPAVAPVTGAPGSLVLVGDMFTLSSTTTGGLWGSSNTSVATVDANTGAVTINYGGQVTISYTVLNVITGCDSTVSVDFNAVWPNTLALYAGHDGTSTDVIVVDSVAASDLMATGFGAASPCGNGGYSGITVPFADSIFSVSGPYVSYKVYPDPTPGAALNVFQIHAGARVSGSGPTFARLAYRVGTGSWVVDDSVALTSGSCGASANSWYWTLGGPTITGITDSIEVAVFPYKPASGSGTFQLNTLEVYGQVSDDSPCAGTPAGGTIDAIFNTKICDSGYRTLELTHNGGVGISFQWQESANGTTGWTNISGAVNTFYTTDTLTDTNYYRVVVTCANGGATANSNVLEIDVIPTPVVTITNPRADIAVGSAWDFDASGVIGGDTVQWFSNYVSTADVDSGTGVITGGVQFPAKDVVVTLTVKRDGCYGTDKDTFDCVDSSAIAYYLGSNGSSAATVALQSGATATDLAVFGLGTGSPCAKGGMSGINNAPATFDDTKGASFKVGTSGFPTLAGFSDMRATLRSSGSGPAFVRLAYRAWNGGTAGSWIDNGEDIDVDFDDCGYSMNEVSWFDNTSTPYSFTPILTSSLSGADSIEFGVFPFDAASSTGTFQINSISIRGQVASVSGSGSVDSATGSGGSLTGADLCLGTHSVEVDGSYSNVYWYHIIPNDPSVAYFAVNSIKNATTTGDLMTVSAYSSPVIGALAYNGSSFIVASSQPNSYTSSACSPKPGRTNGVDNVQESATDVAFYPNPASTVLNVKAFEAVKVSIYSIDGKLLISENNARSLNISQLANGMYMIHAYNKDNHLIKTEKLIKQ